MKVEYHPSTVTDLNKAISHYEAEQPGLGSELRREIGLSAKRIAKSPYLYPEVRAEIRRRLVHRFPFSILYRIIADEKVRVLVIRHHRRHQAFWMRRR